jgi:DNA-binding FadR family transcriptional regulator
MPRLVYQRAPLPIIHRKVVEPREWLEAAQRTAQEHRSILEAIHEGEEAEARRMLRIHLAERHLVPLRQG